MSRPSSKDLKRTLDSSWRTAGSRTKRTLGRLDRGYLLARRSIKRKLGIDEPLRLDVYRSYAGPSRAIVRGRALENELPRPPQAEDSVWDNLRRSLRQIESDEVPHLRVRVSFGGQHVDLLTDAEGYFNAELELSSPPLGGWNEAWAQVVDDAHPYKAEGRGQLLTPQARARFGVISDIDDTILQSHVQNRFKQATLTMLGNAVTRLSFKGTSHLYRGLERAGQAAPFFYVSRSGWSIHAVLEHFIRHQDLPEGPLILRHVGLLTNKQAVRGHKRREILRIFDTFPSLSFILIGDSGQRDAAIYGELAALKPARVRAILIRDVSGRTRRESVERGLAQTCPTTCPWLVFDDHREAESFCEARGLWLPPDP